MTYVAALLVVALVAVSLAFSHVIRQLIREQARERQLMLNQIMHLSGHTWTPPPSELVAVTPLDEQQTLADELELLDPAQLPVDYS